MLVPRDRKKLKTASLLTVFLSVGTVLSPLKAKVCISVSILLPCNGNGMYLAYEVTKTTKLLQEVVLVIQTLPSESA